MSQTETSSGSNRKQSNPSSINTASKSRSISPLLDKNIINNNNHKNGYNSINISTEDDIIDITKTKHPLPSSPRHDNNISTSGKSSICGVFWNMINALIGAGILAIPFVYTQCGLFGGILLIFLFGLLCQYTLNIMIKTAQIYDVTEYEDLGHKSIGTFGYILTSMCLFLEDYGTMLNYLIILGDSAFGVMQIWGYNSYHNRQIIIITVSMIIIFPPCLWRDISLYQTFSAFKFIAIGIVVSVVIYQYFLYRVFMVHSDDNDGLYNNQVTYLLFLSSFVSRQTINTHSVYIKICQYINI